MRLHVCTHIKLNSYSNASVFLSLCRMRTSVFCGHERLTNRSISKRYLKNDIAIWVEKSSTSRAFHARDTGFYWSSENTLHERFIASSGIWVWMKTLQLIAKRYKTLTFEYEFSLTTVHEITLTSRPSWNCTDCSIVLCCIADIYLNYFLP